MDDRHEALRRALEHSVLDGPGTLASESRIAAADPAQWDRLPATTRTVLQKIWTSAYRVTDEDIDALKQTYGEDESFELIVACALGAARIRLEAGLAALESE